NAAETLPAEMAPSRAASTSSRMPSFNGRRPDSMMLKQDGHFSASRLITARIALWLIVLVPLRQWCCTKLAPGDNVTRIVPAGGGDPRLILTSKHGNAAGLPHTGIERLSHASLYATQPYGGMGATCVFMPPSMY